MTATGGATERELCIQWGDSLVTRSRQDTPQTQDEAQEAYARFALACPDFENMIPNRG